MRRIAGIVLLTAALAFGARAAPAPRLLASIWLNCRGEGSLPDGRVFRLTDEHGKPYLLSRKAVLEVLDTKP